MLFGHGKVLPIKSIVFNTSKELSNYIVYNEGTSNFEGSLTAVSDMTSFFAMFQNTGYNATDFTLNLGDNFNTSSVTTMYYMLGWTGRYGNTLIYS